MDKEISTRDKERFISSVYNTLGFSLERKLGMELNYSGQYPETVDKMGKTTEGARRTVS